jgi:hypothetical protein
MPFFSLAIGCLCGLGARKGDGDYFPAFMGTLILITTTILLNTLMLIAAEVGISPWELLFKVVFQGQVTAFLNDGLELVGSSARSYAAIPIAFYMAYKVHDRD